MMRHAQDSNSEEATRLELHIQTRLSGRVRGLRVVHRDSGIVLQGRTCTYYAKQLVQHTAMTATDLPILANEIEVCYVSEKRRIDCN